MVNIFFYKYVNWYYWCSINFGKYLNKDKKYSFIYPYINKTSLENLFEIISILFPNHNICPCFKYENENDGKYYLIDKNKTINEYIDEYNLNKISLKFYNEIYKSIFNHIIKNLKEKL